MTLTDLFLISPFSTRHMSTRSSVGSWKREQLTQEIVQGRRPVQFITPIPQPKKQRDGQQNRREGGQSSGGRGDEDVSDVRGRKR